MNKHPWSLLLAATAGLAAILTPLSARAAATIYVSNAGNNTIEQFTEAGVGSVFASTGLNNPQGLAFDSAGNLYVANAGNNTIMKFTPGGVGSVFASTGLDAPQGLAFDSAGNLYALNPGLGTIEKFTPGGAGSVFASGFGPNTGRNGLAFDIAGNLYVATAGSGFFPSPVRILRFTPGGVGSVFAEEDFSFLTTFTEGLAFDTLGNLYVAMTFPFSDGQAFIQKYTPGGQGSRFANSFYSPVGPPNYPSTMLGGMAFDSGGSLYAANPVSNAIEKFTPGGVSSVFADAADGLSQPSFVAIRDNVPEPSTWAMLGLGLPALLGAARLRRRKE